MEIHDLAVSNLVAGREKDLEFLRGLLRHRLVQTPTVRARLTTTPLTSEVLQSCHLRLDRLASEARNLSHH